MKQTDKWEEEFLKKFWWNSKNKLENKEDNTNKFSRSECEVIIKYIKTLYTIKREFIKNYCNDRGIIRRSRGAFWDEKDKLHTILEYFDKYKIILQSQEDEYLNILKEIKKSEEFIVCNKDVKNKTGYDCGLFIFKGDIDSMLNKHNIKI